MRRYSSVRLLTTAYTHRALRHLQRKGKEATRGQDLARPHPSNSLGQNMRIQNLACFQCCVSKSHTGRSTYHGLDRRTMGALAQARLLVARWAYKDGDVSSTLFGVWVPQPQRHRAEGCKRREKQRLLQLLGPGHAGVSLLWRFARGRNRLAFRAGASHREAQHL